MNITIIGAGSIGLLLAERLSKDNHNITIIEKNTAIANYTAERVDALVIEGNGTDYQTMINAGVKNADIVAALTTVDEVNILSCQLAKKIGAKQTIARIRNSQYISDSPLFASEEIGVDLFVHPEWETAKAICRLIRQASATDIIEIANGKIQFLGLRIDKSAKFLHIPFKEFPSYFGDLPFRIVAVKRRTRTIIPRGDDILIKGDQIFFICNPQFKNEIMNIFGKSDVTLKNVMIVGGGMIGKFTAKELEKKMNIKIIEKNEAKAEHLAKYLDSTLVINGDGSDLDLLHSEGLTNMDEVICVTGDDETNIISSIVARHLEVPRTITLINKNNYVPLVPALNLDAIVSKQHLTVNVIGNFVRRTGIAQFNEIPGLDAVIVEFEVKEKSKITKSPLKGIRFPEKSLVGAILKNGSEVVIPTGDTVIQAGDRTVIFCEPENLLAVEKLFS